MIKENLIYIYFLIVPLFSYIATYKLINPIRKTSFKLGVFLINRIKGNLTQIMLYSFWWDSNISWVFCRHITSLFGKFFFSLDFDIASQEYQFIKKVLKDNYKSFFSSAMATCFKISPYIRLFVENLHKYLLLKG